jgi:hypothetical protein
MPEKPMTRLEQLGQLSKEELLKRLTELEAKRPTNGLKVSTKGAVSLYGVGRFPVTLYKSQWDKVIEMVQTGVIQKFMDENIDQLASKDKD